MSSLTWNIAYGRKQFTLHLNSTPTWVEAVSPILEKVACLFTCRLGFSWAYRIGNGIMSWIYDQQKPLLSIPITNEQAFTLQPGEWEWLFEDDDSDV